MKKIFNKAILVTLSAILLSGCTFYSNDEENSQEASTEIDGDNKDHNNEGDNKSNNKNNDNNKDNNDEEKRKKEDKTETETEDLPDINPKEKIDLSLKPNEVGQVMVLMYHGIDDKEATWVRTPENFRRDLETLYEKGYRAISLKDFAQNNINVEQGYSPVVFTFDDGLKNSFNIIEENGEKVIDPNCAVGIMEEFKKEHPDFNMTASFFLNGSNPFRQPELIEYKLNWLVDNGYDVGNHTLGHNNMEQVTDPKKLQKYIGKQAQYIESFLDEYQVNTYALAYGKRPNKDMMHLLEKGEYEGDEYNNIAILNVGWDPSVSPNDKKFNPLSIHRVRASETNVDNVGMYNWMSVFDKYPERRFISDGNSDIVTVPKEYENKLDTEQLGEKELYLYEIEND